MKLLINYEPTPKGVPRTRYVNGTILTYYHWKTTTALESIRALIKQENIEPYPEYTPLKLVVTFYRTKSKWLKGKAKRESMPVRKPDLDNFLKLTIDTLNGILFPDDAQITTIEAHKRWSTNEHGYIELELSEDFDNA